MNNSAVFQSIHELRFFELLILFCSQFRPIRQNYVENLIHQLLFSNVITVLRPRKFSSVVWIITPVTATPGFRNFIGTERRNFTSCTEYCSTNLTR